jgi:hypothetical protein
VRVISRAPIPPSENPEHAPGTDMSFSDALLGFALAFAAAYLIYMWLNR